MTLFLNSHSGFFLLDRIIEVEIRFFIFSELFSLSQILKSLTCADLHVYLRQTPSSS